jgi:hypothetical protein
MHGPFSYVCPHSESHPETRALTIIGTEYRHGDWADKPKLPLIGGHEGCGETRFLFLLAPVAAWKR